MRHPAAPDLFVWLAGEYDERSIAFKTGADETGRYKLPIRGRSPHRSAMLTISFSETHPGMSREGAEKVAAFVGGVIEEVALLD